MGGAVSFLSRKGNQRGRLGEKSLTNYDIGTVTVQCAPHLALRASHLLVLGHSLLYRLLYSQQEGTPCAGTG